MKLVFIDGWFSHNKSPPSCVVLLLPLVLEPVPASQWLSSAHKSSHLVGWGETSVCCMWGGDQLQCQWLVVLAVLYNSHASSSDMWIQSADVTLPKKQNKTMTKYKFGSVWRVVVTCGPYEGGAAWCSCSWEEMFLNWSTSATDDQNNLI